MVPRCGVIAPAGVMTTYNSIRRFSWEETTVTTVRDLTGNTGKA